MYFGKKLYLWALETHRKPTRQDLETVDYLKCMQVKYRRPAETIVGDPVRIRMFLGLPDPDTLVRGMDLDPSLFLYRC
jgi:hypothetical protein